jgi:hypothetical protein
MHRLHRAVAIALASCLLAAPASAQLVSFTFSGGFSASWTLPQSPTPDFVNGDRFGIDVVDIVYEGAPRTVAVDFFSESLNGGLCIDTFGGCVLGDLVGDQLFTGSNASPEFVLGTYSLFNAITETDVRLAIERVADVPEPSALLLLGAGAAGLIFVRGRHRANAD